MRLLYFLSTVKKGHQVCTIGEIGEKLWFQIGGFFLFGVNRKNNCAKKVKISFFGGQGAFNETEEGNNGWTKK